MSKSELESAIQRRAQKVFREHGSYVFKTHGDIYSKVGIPDLVACVPVTVKELRNHLSKLDPECKIGLFVTAEMKREGHLNEVSDAQFVVGKEIENAGGCWGAYDNTETLAKALDILQGKTEEIEAYEQYTYDFDGEL